MEAIVLCGGLGTRLSGVISQIPKPMAPVNNRPFLEFLFDSLIKNGIEKVVCSVGYKHDIIISHFKSIYKSIKIDYCIETIPLGTGGAIKKSISKIKNEEFFIFNGDSLYDVNFNDLKKIKSNGVDICILLKKMKNFQRYGSIEFNDNHSISKFNEKQFVKEGFINSGIYYASKRILDQFPKKDVFSFEKDFLEKKVSELNFKAVLKEGYFIDIGIPEDYFNFVKKNEK